MTTEIKARKEQPKMTKDLFSSSVKKTVDELREYSKSMNNLIDVLGRSINADVSFSAIDDSKKVLEQLKKIDIRTSVKNIHSVLVNRAKERMKEV